MSNEGCIFCKIVEGDSPSHVIWEDIDHIAFLSIFPNTLGATVVIPKPHRTSYIFDQSEDVLTSLVVAAKKVACLLDLALEGVGRTAMIFEGYGVDHLHAKLFPMHGTGSHSDFRKISSNVNKYFDSYEGYVSSHDYKRADDDQLSRLAEEIRTCASRKLDRGS